MAFKFKGLLSPEDRVYLDRMRGEMRRLYALPDRFLGRAILDYARAARAKYPEDLGAGGHERRGYALAFFWDVVPEVARRLGESRFLPQERVSADVVAASGSELRDWVHYCLGCTGRRPRVADPGDVGLDPWDVLLHEPANGNPVAMAVDRISPVCAPNRGDGLSSAISEVSGHRGFEPPHLMWEPGMQEYGRDPGETIADSILRP